MYSGKAEEMFEEWYESDGYYPMNLCERINHDKAVSYDYLEFGDLPFDMRIGVYLAWLEHLGFKVSIRHQFGGGKEEHFVDIHYMGINYKLDAPTRTALFSDLFLYANELINKRNE